MKTNNSLDNLEVVTHSDNVRHAMDTGLVSTVKPVKIKFHDTKEIKRYPSMIAASRALGMQDDCVLQRLENPNYKWTLWSDNTQIILESDGEFEDIRYIPKEGGGMYQNMSLLTIRKMHLKRLFILLLTTIVELLVLLLLQLGRHLSILVILLCGICIGLKRWTILITGACLLN